MSLCIPPALTERLRVTSGSGGIPFSEGSCCVVFPDSPGAGVVLFIDIKQLDPSRQMPEERDGTAMCRDQLLNRYASPLFKRCRCLRSAFPKW